METVDQYQLRVSIFEHSKVDPNQVHLDPEAIKKIEDAGRLTDIRPMLIQDSREQNGFGLLFKGPCVIEGLPVGDYSVAGLQDRIAIERKSLSDLVGSLTHDRQRFERELAKARSYQFFAVVVEGSAQAILRGDYGRSEANPKAVWESVAAFNARYCPFHFLGDRRTAAAWTESVLLKFAREHVKAIEQMTKASKKAAAGYLDSNIL